MASNYAWIIDKDHRCEEGPGDFRAHSDTGITGPSRAPRDLLDRLNRGEGDVFQLWDDDGEVYYTGRIVFRGKDGASTTDGFAPLDDFGTPNAGCTSIHYRRDDGTYEPEMNCYVSRAGRMT